MRPLRLLCTFRVFLTVHHEYIDEFQNAKGLKKQEKDKPEFMIVPRGGPQRVSFDRGHPQKQDCEQQQCSGGKFKQKLHTGIILRLNIRLQT